MPLDCQRNAAKPTLLLLLPLANTTINTDIEPNHLSTAAWTAKHSISTEISTEASTLPDSAAQLINRPRPTRHSWPLHHHHQHDHVACLLLTDPHMVAQTGEINTNLYHLNGQAQPSCNRSDSVTPSTPSSLAPSAAAPAPHTPNISSMHHSPAAHWRGSTVAVPAEDNITATHLPLLYQLKPFSSCHFIASHELGAHTYYIT